jgi:hypothetical protein
MQKCKILKIENNDIPPQVDIKMLYTLPMIYFFNFLLKPLDNIVDVFHILRPLLGPNDI